MQEICFAIPCYNAAQTLAGVAAEIRAVCARQGWRYRLILVNDGSCDATCPLICELAAADPCVHGIDLARNVGQARARMAALPWLRGHIAVFLDDDGQHPVEAVDQLVAKVEEGYDLVFADFSQKQHSGFRRLASRLNGRLLELTGAKPPGVRLSSFFALSPLAVEQLQHYDSPFPSFTSYIMQCTDRVADVPLPHRPRAAGRSGYTFGKLFSQWLTGFTNFSVVPLRLASALGALIAAAGFLYGLVLVVRKLCLPHIVAGYTSIMAVLLLVGGLLMLMLGLVGEYLGRLYMTASRQPVYVVRREAGAPQGAAEENAAVQNGRQSEAPEGDV